MAQDRFESVETIVKTLKLTTGDAQTLRAIVKHPERFVDERGIPLPCAFPKSFESTWKWIRSCYNMPSVSEIQERMIDELLDTHGVEAIRGPEWDTYYGDVLYTYCNQGDPYIPTVMFDCRKHRFFIACWGDIVERENL